MDAIRPSLRRSAVCAVVFAFGLLLVRAAATAHAQECGNGIVEPPEQCDFGGDDSACPGMCADDCTCALCGDNVVAPGFEECDGTDDAACPGACQGPTDPIPCACPICGDGALNQPGEVCEQGNDAACPGQCTDHCTCAVCGDNVADGPDETCDGTDDSACPGQCGAPDGNRPCSCPIPPYKCAYKKGTCTSKTAEYLLKCHYKAERLGLGPVEPNCVEHGHVKFDGGANPSSGCFEKLEAAAEGTCFTNDDTGTMEISIDDFVNSVVALVDPSYPAPVVDFCSAGKKLCVAKLTSYVMKCLGKAEAKNIPLDPVCIQKAETKFSGDPRRSCIDKLTIRYPGCTTSDAAALQSASEDFAHDVTCALDSSGPDCP